MLTIESAADGTIVLNGRLDAVQSAKAQAFLDQHTGRLHLDCRGLEYISSAGLGVLLKTQKRLMTASGGLRLTGVGVHLLDIFRYSGFDRILEIEAAA